MVVYCRFSSDDWRCDLWCYGDAETGWTTHVAGRRLAEVDAVHDDRRRAGPESDMMRRMRLALVYGAAELVPIGGAFDGQSFVDRTVAQFHHRLLMLRSAGYRFPDSVINAAVREALA